MTDVWQVIKEDEHTPKLKNPVFLEGLPVIGNVG